MKKIIVIGCPGSGKSTFSIALHNKTKIPLYHLDMMFWKSDKTIVDKDIFLSRLENVLKENEWIIDGNYASTMEKRISECDTVFFLDYSTDVCLDGVRKRQGKPRADMPWIETEDDAEFIDFIKNFKNEERLRIIALLEKYYDKSVFVFTDREQADEFLKGIDKK